MVSIIILRLSFKALKNSKIAKMTRLLRFSKKCSFWLKTGFGPRETLSFMIYELQCGKQWNQWKEKKRDSRSKWWKLPFRSTSKIYSWSENVFYMKYTCARWFMHKFVYEFMHNLLSYAPNIPDPRGPKNGNNSVYALPYAQTNPRNKVHW